MDKTAFHHLVRAAGAVLNVDGILVIGSQAVHASVHAAALPGDYSMEADIAILGDSDGRAADLIDGAIGEGSLFHETHGYYGQGVTEATAKLPSGWRERLIAYDAPDTNGVTAYCRDPCDLWLSKAIAGREKDQLFCRVMLATRVVAPDALRERLALVGELPEPIRARLEAMIEAAGRFR